MSDINGNKSNKLKQYTEKRFTSCDCPVMTEPFSGFLKLLKGNHQTRKRLFNLLIYESHNKVTHDWYIYLDMLRYNFIWTSASSHVRTFRAPCDGKFERRSSWSPFVHVFQQYDDLKTSVVSHRGQKWKSRLDGQTSMNDLINKWHHTRMLFLLRSLPHPYADREATAVSIHGYHGPTLDEQDKVLYINHYPAA